MSSARPARIVYDETLRHYHRHAVLSDHNVIEYSAEQGAEVNRPLDRSAVSSLWCAQLRCDLYSLGLKSVWLDPSEVGTRGRQSYQSWKAKVKRRVHTREHAHWKAQVSQHSDLRSYVAMRSLDKLELQSYLTVRHGGWNDRIRVGRMALTALRLRSSVLAICTGQRQLLLERDRICPLCCAAVETEQHFLLVCSSRSDERTKLWQQLDGLVNDAAAVEAAAAAAPLFSAATLPAAAQLTLLTGGGHPSITDVVLTRRVISAVMIAVGQWMTLRQQQYEQMREFEALQQL